MKAKIITIILFIFSFFVIFSHQYNYNVITEWDRTHTELNKLNPNIILLNNVLTIGNDGIGATILEHGLPISIFKSLGLGKNQWLMEKTTQDYIDVFMKTYGYRGGIYNIVFNDIIRHNTTNKDVSDFYLELLYKNLSNEKYVLNDTIDNNLYITIHNELLDTFCENDSFPLHSNFSNLYNSLGLYFYQNQEYKLASCFSLLSGYENNLISWQTLTLSFYRDYLMNMDIDNFVGNYNNIEKEYIHMSNLLKKYTKNVDFNNIHRNTTKNNNIILLNQVINNNINILRKHYLDNIEKNEY